MIWFCIGAYLVLLAVGVAWLVANGERGPHEPADLAAGCLSMLGRPEVAAWALEDHRRVAA